MLNGIGDYQQKANQQCPFCKQYGSKHKANCPYYGSNTSSNMFDDNNIFSSIFNTKESKYD